MSTKYPNKGEDARKKDAESDDAPRLDVRDPNMIVLALSVLLVVIVALVFLTRAAMSFIVGDGPEPGQINTEDVASSESTEENTGAARDRDSKSNDDSSSNSTASGDKAGMPLNSQGSDIRARDIDFADTVDNSGTQVVNAEDRLTNDQDVIRHIEDIFQLLFDETKGMSYDEEAGVGENDGSDENSDAAALANQYFYNDTGVVGAVVKGHYAGWRYDPSQVYVFDYNSQDADGVYKVKMHYVTSSGEQAFLITGWYDPVIDSIKVTASRLTNAGWDSLLNAQQ